MCKQIKFATVTTTFVNLDNYILQFGQIHLTKLNANSETAASLLDVIVHCIQPFAWTDTLSVNVLHTNTTHPIN